MIRCILKILNDRQNFKLPSREGSSLKVKNSNVRRFSPFLVYWQRRQKLAFHLRPARTGTSEWVLCSSWVSTALLITTSVQITQNRTYRLVRDWTIYRWKFGILYWVAFLWNQIFLTYIYVYILTCTLLFGHHSFTDSVHFKKGCTLKGKKFLLGERARGGGGGYFLSFTILPNQWTCKAKLLLMTASLSIPLSKTNEFTKQLNLHDFEFNPLLSGNPKRGT